MDERSLQGVADRLFALPNVHAVSLGGSRAVGTHRPDSVDHELAEASEGRFRIEPLLFHLAGIPTYLVVAELALNRVLRGELPRPGYPPALRWTAPSRWWELCVHNLAYAREYHARAGRVIPCAGLLALGVSQAAHAVLAARGEWVTNDKALHSRAGMGEADGLLSGLRAEPRALQETVDATLALCEKSVTSSTRDRDGELR